MIFGWRDSAHQQLWSNKLTSVDGVHSSHQRTSCWCADRKNVVVVKNDSFCSKSVDVRGLDFGAVKSNITPAEVIGYNK